MKPFIVVDDKKGGFVAIPVKEIECIAGGKKKDTLIGLTNGNIVRTATSFDEVIKLFDSAYK